jgi:DNA-binding NarL/FixJ family response regulator
MSNTVKIIVADDHPIFREGLIKIIQLEKNFNVCNSCGNGQEALEAIRTKQPNVAVLDISMPCLSGLDVATVIAKEKLKTIPIILTMYKEEEYLDAALENGVKGYLLKDSTSNEIIDCIKSVLQGGLYISQELMVHITDSKRTKSSKDENYELINQLTSTERKILKLLAENKTSLQIAEELFISHRTVQNHRNNIAHKLNLNGHNRLLLFAIEHKSTF